MSEPSEREKNLAVLPGAKSGLNKLSQSGVKKLNYVASEMLVQPGTKLVYKKTT